MKKLKSIKTITITNIYEINELVKYHEVNVNGIFKRGQLIFKDKIYEKEYGIPCFVKKEIWGDILPDLKDGASVNTHI